MPVTNIVPTIDKAAVLVDPRPSFTLLNEIAPGVIVAVAVLTENCTVVCEKTTVPEVYVKLPAKLTDDPDDGANVTVVAGVFAISIGGTYSSAT